MGWDISRIEQGIDLLLRNQLLLRIPLKKLAKKVNGRVPRCLGKLKQPVSLDALRPLDKNGDLAALGG